ncbi:hypothetical protein PQQ86_11820 [Paraburkholderia sediminicola]|uniref:hypothetical protein n=1 Tax=Paraburkholderia TaxID=1822464 RepID=UPI0038BB9FB2
MKKLLLSLSLALYALASFGTTLNPVQLLNPLGSTSGQAVVSTGPTTAPAWGNVTATSLAAQAANTVLANVTGSAASPTAVAMPSCSTANSALQYTSGTGFNCVTNSAITTGTLAQFAATTSAQLAGVLSDETGTGSAVFGTNPTISTPTINGITSGANAAAGVVGQCIQGIVTAGSPVSLTSGTAANVISIPLTAGDWFVYGFTGFTGTATTTVLYYGGGASPTSATLANSVVTPAGNATIFATAGGFGVSVPMQLINISASATYYLVAQASFGASTMGAFGTITACRWH